MKEQGFRFLAIICLIGIIGTTGGLEWSMFGAGRWLMQTALFFVGMVVCHNTAEALHRTKRRRRKAVK